MVGYPGSQNIDQHPYYPTKIAKAAWRLYHHRFTKSGRWFLSATLIVNLSFSLFWSFEIQTWYFALFINCMWLPDIWALCIPLSGSVRLSSQTVVRFGQVFPINLIGTGVYKGAVVHLDGLPRALQSLHENGIYLDDSNGAYIDVEAIRRGYWKIPAIRIAREGPFGLLNKTFRHAVNHTITVLPAEPGGRSAPNIPSLLSLTSGLISSSLYATNNGNDWLTEYTAGDSPNSIAWRVSAKSLASGKPVISVQKATLEHDIGVHIWIDVRVVEPTLPLLQHWGGGGKREPLSSPIFEALILDVFAFARGLQTQQTRILSIGPCELPAPVFEDTLEGIPLALANVKHFAVDKLTADGLFAISATESNPIIVFSANPVESLPKTLFSGLPKTCNILVICNRKIHRMDRRDI